MEPYRSVGGDSGVTAYESGPDFIRVQFTSGNIYLYNYEVTGRENVEHMKQLASNGQGLALYINREVRRAFAWRER